MKKLLFISLLMFASLLHAQVLNVRLGINHSDQDYQFDGKSMNGGHVFYPGLSLGAQIDFDMGNNWYFSPGLFYDAKGYAEKIYLIVIPNNDPSINPEGKETNAKIYYRFNYLDIPVLVKKQFELGSHLKMYAGAGGYLGINFGNCAYGDGSSKCVDIYKDLINTIDGGVQLEIGFIYHDTFTLNAGYSYGLLDISKEKKSTIFNRMLYLQLGYRFDLKK